MIQAHKISTQDSNLVFDRLLNGVVKIMLMICMKGGFNRLQQKQNSYLVSPKFQEKFFRWDYRGFIWLMKYIFWM
jgi:hypothetical protein